MNQDIISECLSKLRQFEEASYAKFVKSPMFPNRESIVGQHYKFYVRYGRFGLGRSIVDQCLVIAAVDFDPAFQNQGIFKAILQALEADISIHKAIMVECVNEPNLAEALSRYGYTHDEDLRPNNYFKLLA